MKRFLKIFMLILVCASAANFASAQSRDGHRQFRENIREYKHKYIQQKLNLSRDQADEFFQLYDKMEDEINQLNSDARTIESKYFDAPEGSVTDIEYETATNALIENKCKEAELEKQYYADFDKILNKRQLFELRKVERDFTMQLLKFNRRNGNKPNEQ